VNSGYLILCDTALPGYDLTQVNGESLADCIAACNSYVASSSPQQRPCVAVEYDQVSFDPTSVNKQVLMPNLGRVNALHERNK
jgi:hypothetical protein